MKKEDKIKCAVEIFIKTIELCELTEAQRHNLYCRLIASEVAKHIVEKDADTAKTIKVVCGNISRWVKDFTLEELERIDPIDALNKQTL